MKKACEQCEVRKDIEDFLVNSCKWKIKRTSKGIEYRSCDGQQWLLSYGCKEECPYELERMMDEQPKTN